MSFRVRIAATLTAVVTFSALFAASGTASAHESDDNSASGSGRTALFAFEFDVHRDSDGKAHGYFSAKATSPADTLIAPQGPATCAAFDGNKVGFLYPLEDNSKPAALKGQVILITAQDNGPGQTDAIGFLGPAPAAAFPDCHPNVATMPVDGNIKVGH